MLRQRVEVFRSKEFMAFCHREMNDALCCACQEQYWEELHHFGGQGAMSRKPSDLEVARMCKKCHMKNDFKRLSLIKQNKLDLLLTFQDDAMELHEAWFRHLEGNSKMPTRCRGCEHCKNNCCKAKLKHEEPDADCALDDMWELIGQTETAKMPEALVQWSNKRSANVIKILAEPMQEILESDSLESIKFIANQALKASGLDNE
jgi:hypothetical protein